MRIIFIFFIGFFAFFFIGDLFKRAFKKTPYSIPGLFIILLGFWTGFWGYLYFDPPLNILLAFFLIGSGCGLTIHHLLAHRYLISEHFEHSFIHRHETFFERLIEITPGALTWTALTSPFWLALALPYALAYLIILADIYWLVTAIKTAILIYIGYRKVESAKKQDWLQKLKTDFPTAWQDYYQLILLPTYKESLDVLIPTYQAILNSDYPQRKIILCIGFEERDDPQKITDTTKYINQFKSAVADIFTTIHPYGLPGEVSGQGSNKNWMIKKILPRLTKQGIDPQQVFVTTLDADFIIHPQFLAGALHKYLSTPALERDKRSYTGAFFYYNNYWQAPTPMRLIAVGTSFWQISEMVFSDKYRNFSSLSVNLQSLLDIGLWIPDKVNDDSGFYWKAYFHFNGNYKVVPHYMPISADAVLDVNLWKTFQNQYLQLKRWAYGIEHLPFIITQYFKRTDINFWDKTDKVFFSLWGDFRWGFLALFVTFGGTIIQLVNPHYNQSAVSVNLPILSSWLLTAAFFGLFATIYVHEKTAPRRPKGWNIINYIWSYLQWLLIPVIMVTISTFPAIHAQTSLMLGRYMKEFRVTNKTRQMN